MNSEADVDFRREKLKLSEEEFKTIARVNQSIAEASLASPETREEDAVFCCISFFMARTNI